MVKKLGFMLVNHKLENIQGWYMTIYNLEFWLCTNAMGFYEIIYFLQIFLIQVELDVWLISINCSYDKSSQFWLPIFWYFSHSIQSYREFVCSSPGATPFHYAAIDSLSQYTQTKFFYYVLHKPMEGLKIRGAQSAPHGWDRVNWFA